MFNFMNFTFVSLIPQKKNSIIKHSSIPVINYCYNIILIPFILHEIKIKLFLSLLKEEKVVFDGMKRLPLQ